MDEIVSRGKQHRSNFKRIDIHTQILDTCSTRFGVDVVLFGIDCQMMVWNIIIGPGEKSSNVVGISVVFLLLIWISPLDLDFEI